MTTDERISALILQLRKLSEAGTLKLARDHRGKPESSPPPGAKPDQSGPPDPDDSLLVWFLWKLDKATTQIDKLGLVAQTEIRLQKRLDGKLSRALEAGAFGTAQRSETAKDRDNRIVADYEGLHPAEISAVESERSSFCSQANVRKVRMAAGRDTETGVLTKQDMEDREYANELREHGLSIGSIAIRMGRPKSTVANWLKKTNGDEKAA